MSSFARLSWARWLPFIFILVFFMPALLRRLSAPPGSRRFDVLPRQVRKNTNNSSTSSTSSFSTSVQDSTSTGQYQPSPVILAPPTPSLSNSSSLSLPGFSGSLSSSTATSDSSTFTTNSTSTSTSTSLPSSPISHNTTNSTATTNSTSTTSSSSASRSPTSSPTNTATSSSTTSSTSSTLVPTTNVTPETSQATPSSLLPVPTSPNITQTSSPTLAPVSTGNVSSASIGFMQNKSAVAGTFTALALCVVGVIIALVIFVRRKRRANRANSEFFTGYDTDPEVMRRTSARTASAAGHSSSPGPSVTELATQVPMDAFTTTSHHRSSNYGYYPSLSQYGLSPVEEREYPSHAVPLPARSEPSIYSTYTAQPTDLYYIPPPGQGSAPPPQTRRSSTRGSYQTSVDSFYGAA